ncbi:polyprenyl synthetase family protein [Fuerstiella marisgermanici]|uniref:Farnesyl diphosphate synthase n=1 Tax=Fuerstiella marisgermanici TaxID=1891926 RepID=A0A1P8WMZ9_9PLAN|nr:polyprenyl synthetase family protein [Fuerstiella marisgermanici]APZ95435.1 Farnesyl diphosphate synthase [Fuerstiella marisgermanici]
MPPEFFEKHYSALKARVESALSESIASRDWPVALKNAVEYSLMAGGKRLRPVLVMMAAEICDGEIEDAIPAACALEMIHTYSLIHDDLPSMDDDDLRRGRPTSHRVFGEALAILAGDALLTLAFETLATAPTAATVTATSLQILATAAGGSGMVGGQILDLEAERGEFPSGIQESSGIPRQKNASNSSDSAGALASGEADSPIAASETPPIHVEQLIQIHRMKTGALITAALELGAVTSQASTDRRNQLRHFGQCVGLAFQIADDLLDVTGSDERLGKVTGRDNELGKLTYPFLIGIEASRNKAQQLVDEACHALAGFDDRADCLRHLARFIVERDH